MPNYNWISLNECLPVGKETVLLFSPIVYFDPGFPGHSVSVSNPDFARENAIKRGYTHWCRITYPLPASIPDVIDWSDWEYRCYWLPEDNEPVRPPPTIRQKVGGLIFGIAYRMTRDRSRSIFDE